MSTSPPLAVLLLATVVATLLLAASSSVSLAAAATVGGGRMVFVHGPRTTKQVVGARGNEWRRYRAARVEDEVVPEFAGILQATNSRGGSISAGALNKDTPGCQSGNQCAAGAGGSYTRPCTYQNQCSH